MTATITSSSVAPRATSLNNTSHNNNNVANDSVTRIERVVELKKRKALASALAQLLRARMCLESDGAKPTATSSAAHEFSCEGPWWTREIDSFASTPAQCSVSLERFLLELLAHMSLASVESYLFAIHVIVSLTAGGATSGPPCPSPASTALEMASCCGSSDLDDCSCGYDRTATSASFDFKSASSVPSLRLTPFNVHIVFLAALLLSSKSIDDVPCKAAAFAKTGWTEVHRLVLAERVLFGCLVSHDLTSALTPRPATLVVTVRHLVSAAREWSVGWVSLLQPESQSSALTSEHAIFRELRRPLATRKSPVSAAIPSWL